MKKNIYGILIIAVQLVLLMPLTIAAQSENSALRKALKKDSAGNNTRKIQTLNLIIRQQPGMAAAWQLRGMAKFQLEDYRGAIADLQRAAQLQPANEQANLASGYARLELKQYKAAVADFSRAIAINPSNSITWYHRGFTRQKLRQQQLARLDFRRANELGLKDTRDILTNAEPE